MKFKDLKIGDVFRFKSNNGKIVFKKVVGNNFFNCLDENVNDKYRNGWAKPEDEVIIFKKVKPTPLTFSELPIGAFFKDLCPINAVGKNAGGEGVFIKTSISGCRLVKTGKGCLCSFAGNYEMTNTKPVKRIKRVEN